LFPWKLFVSGKQENHVLEKPPIVESPSPAEIRNWIVSMILGNLSLEK